MKPLNYASKKVIYYSTFKIEMKRWQYVYHEGDESEYFYIVREGVFEVYQNVKMKERFNIKKSIEKANFSDLPDKTPSTSQKIAKLEK